MSIEYAVILAHTSPIFIPLSCVQFCHSLHFRIGQLKIKDAVILKYMIRIL